MGWFDRFRKRAADDTPSAADLAKTLRHGDPTARERAAVQLGEMGTDGWEAIGVLTDALDDDAPRVRLEAADALIKVGGDAERAMATLGALLDSDDAAFRHDVVVQIGRSGERAAPALPSLIRALGDADADVGRVAVDAIFKVGEVSVPSLVDVLRAGPDETRRRAAEAAYKVAPVAIPVFLELTDDDNPQAERFIGACGLADLVPAEENLEIILEAVASDDWLFRSWACRALGLLGPEVRAEAEPVLVSAADDPHEDVRRAASEAVEKVRRPVDGG